MIKEIRQFSPQSQSDWNDAFVNYVNAKYGNLKLSDLKTMNDPDRYFREFKNRIKSGRA